MEFNAISCEYNLSKTALYFLHNCVIRFLELLFECSMTLFLSFFILAACHILLFLFSCSWTLRFIFLDFSCSLFATTTISLSLTRLPLPSKRNSPICKYIKENSTAPNKLICKVRKHTRTKRKKKVETHISFWCWIEIFFCWFLIHWIEFVKCQTSQYPSTRLVLLDDGSLCSLTRPADFTIFLLLIVVYWTILWARRRRSWVEILFNQQRQQTDAGLETQFYWTTNVFTLHPIHRHTLVTISTDWSKNDKYFYSLLLLLYRWISDL